MITTSKINDHSRLTPKYPPPYAPETLDVPMSKRRPWPCGPRAARRKTELRCAERRAKRRALSTPTSPSNATRGPLATNGTPIADEQKGNPDTFRPRGAAAGAHDST